MQLTHLPNLPHRHVNAPCHIPSCLSDADWRSQPDVVPDFRLQAGSSIPESRAHVHRGTAPSVGGTDGGGGRDGGSAHSDGRFADAADARARPAGVRQLRHILGTSCTHLSALRTTDHTPCDMLCVVPMLVGC